jgi:MoxR-like ATPase
VGQPLLLEGAAGTGKTSLAKALADGLNLPYQRLQMYEGLSDDKILYDYDYQKQLLVIEMLKPRLMEECKGMNLKEAEQYALSKLDFYGDDFLLERPVLKAIRSKKQTVHCIDELDKVDEATEYMLYEFFSPAA